MKCLFSLLRQRPFEIPLDYKVAHRTVDVYCITKRQMAQHQNAQRRRSARLSVESFLSLSL